jgi:FkbM family methyltransferase
LKKGARRALLALNRLANIEMADQPGPAGRLPGRLPGAPGAAAEEESAEATRIRRLVGERFPHSLVDVGAFDGVSLSNSRSFAIEGWRSVLIEPHPRQFAKLLKLYAGWSTVSCIQKACSDAPGTLPLFLGSDGEDSMMSTLSTDENPWMDFARSDESVDVEVEALQHILDELSFPRDFGILLVDGEGMDYEILRGANLDRYAPRLILTEEYISNPEKHRKKYRLLLDSGYTFCEMVGSNTLWIRNEWVADCLGL